MSGWPMGSGRSRPIAIRAAPGMNTRIAPWRGEVKHQFAEGPDFAAALGPAGDANIGDCPEWREIKPEM